MSRFLQTAAATGLVLHGLIHLLGTAVYLQFAEIPEFPYKTTLLGGYWDVGTVGIRVFGLLWAGAAVGFVIVAVAFLLDETVWRPILLGTSFFSLVLTLLDWTVAYAGIAVNIGILAALVIV